MVTSEPEIGEIIAQMMQINPTHLPMLLLQIQFERLMIQAVDILRKDLETSIKQQGGRIYDNK